VWVASPFTGELIHVSSEGTIDERIAMANPYAVALGGARADELFVCTAPTWQSGPALQQREGAIIRVSPTS
jgi:hypothetical protein